MFMDIPGEFWETETVSYLEVIIVDHALLDVSVCTRPSRKIRLRLCNCDTV